MNNPQLAAAHYGKFTARNYNAHIDFKHDLYDWWYASSCQSLVMFTIYSSTETL